jgi:hypothetical protein
MPTTEPRRTTRLAAMLGGALAVAGLAHAEGLRPHQATYRTSFKGLGAGDLQLTLKPGAQPDQWTYDTRAFPSFLASFVISGDSVEHSEFSVTPGGVEPHRYQLNDGSGRHGKETDLSYDTAQGRIHGIVEGQPVDMAIEPGTQDVTSIRAAPMVDLAAGREPHEYTMIDGRELKHYVYSKVGTAHMATAAGEVDTVIYRSDRKGSDGRGRVWQYWYAPSLGYLPVRIEQREDGKTRLTFVLRSLKWLPAANGGH